MNAYETLTDRIRTQLVDLETVVANVARLQTKALNSGDSDWWSAVALELHGFYSEFERILQDILTTLGEPVPDGPQWHRELLLQVSSAHREVRPAIIEHATRRCLYEYLAFRHFVRNIYSFTLMPGRVNELATEISGCFLMVKADLTTFLNFLDTYDS